MDWKHNLLTRIKSILRIVVVLSAIVISLGCWLLFSYATASFLDDLKYKHVNWMHVVPDGYEGYLVIRYQCPGGTPLVIKNDTIEVIYKDDGTFCTSDDKFWGQGKVFARTHSGQSIPVRVQTMEGYGLCCDQSMSIAKSATAPEDFSFTLFWVGNLGQMEAFRQAKQIPETPNYSLDVFLEERYHIKRWYKSY